MTHPHLPLMLVGSIFVLTLALPGGAQATDAHFEDERDHARANIIRERAVERSKRALQPEFYLYNDSQQTEIDYYSLSQQIDRLGAAIRQMGDAAARAKQSMQETSGVMPYVHPGNFHRLYGPQGPTVRSVKALLEHRLVVAGNPRVKAGRVISDAETVTAEVVTAKEGALVEKFTIDKSTGIWKREF